jgi:hypothetical protein
MSPQTVQERNKALVLEAFDTLFNKQDYAVAERYWSPDYIQHSAHIEPGREGLFNLIKGMPPTLQYEARRLWQTGISSSCTDGFLGSVRRSTGLRRTFCALKTASLRSIGTSFRTKQRRNNPRAVTRCSATGFRSSDRNRQRTRRLR